MQKESPQVRKRRIIGCGFDPQLAGHFSGCCLKMGGSSVDRQRCRNS